jgi:outer membrane protein assembly factor BamD (BamD/ComL family)/uncharacterized protein YukE
MNRKSLPKILFLGVITCSLTVRATTEEKLTSGDFTVKIHDQHRLRKDARAVTALARITEDFDKQEDKVERPPIDVNEVQALRQFTEKYPNSTSALTAKLRLAVLLANYGLRRFPGLAEQLLGELSDKYQQTWQGKVSRLYLEAVRLHNKLEPTQSDLERMLKYLRQAVPHMEAMDKSNDSEFRAFVAREVGQPVSFADGLRYDMGMILEDMEEVEAAKEIFEELYTKAPESRWGKKAKVRLGSIKKREAREAAEKQAQTLLTEAMAAMQKVTPADGSIPRPGWKNLENLQKLIEIVQKYPSTESTLTARLLITHIYLDPNNPSTNLPKGRNILLKIKEDFPKTWQATIAEMTESSWLFVQKQWETAVQSWEKIYDRIGYLEESQNKAYIQYKKLIQNGRDHDLRGNMLEALMYSYCMVGDLKNAKGVCERLIKECPGHPQSDFAKRALKKLENGVSPYYTPVKRTKEEIAEEIEKVDEE